MVVPISQLDSFVHRVLQGVHAGRAAALKDGIQTDPGDVSFNVQVYDDSAEPVEVTTSEQEQPETTTTTIKGASISTQTQDKPEIVSEETQTTRQGDERTEQSFGRSSVQETSVTS